MGSRYSLLPSYHYIDTENGNINDNETNELRDYIIYGANGKNLIKYPFSMSKKKYEINGVTFTNNFDGTVSANGTATADALFEIATVDSGMKIKAEKQYTLSGCPPGGSESKYYISLNGLSQDKIDSGNGISFDGESEDKQISIYITIKNGINVSNALFKPQLEFGYSKTSFEQFNAVGDDIKNYISPPFSEGSIEKTGINYVDNLDGSFSFSGTATPKNSYYGIMSRLDRYIEKKKYLLAVDRKGHEYQQAYMYIYPTDDVATDWGNISIYSRDCKIVDLTKYDYTKVRLNFVVNYNQTVENGYCRPIFIDMHDNNILEFPYETEIGTTRHGVTSSLGEDNKIILNGTVDEGNNVIFYYTKKLKIEKGKRYILSGAPETDDIKNFQVIATFRDEKGNIITNGTFYDTNSASGTEIKIDDDYAYLWIYIHSQKTGYVFDNVEFDVTLIALDDAIQGNKKILIKNGDYYTVMYVKDKLSDGESISFRENSLPEVLLQESNSLSVETSVKPSKVLYNYYTYK